MIGKQFAAVILAVLFCLCYGGDARFDVYERFSGKRIGAAKLGDLNDINYIEKCTVPIRRCNGSDDRRVDGSCNNLEFPTRGSILQPYGKMVLQRSNEKKSSQDIPSVFSISMNDLMDVKKAGYGLNSLAVGILDTLLMDISSTLQTKSKNIPLGCCTSVNQNSGYCHKSKVADSSDDECLKILNIQSFQDLKCVKETDNLEMANYATPLIDLSHIYGTSEEQLSQRRMFEGGLLREDVRHGRVFPAESSNVCFTSISKELSSCIGMGQNILASALKPATALIYLWQFRYHNYLARGLSKVNPCWNDEQIFQAAKKLNIAIFQEIIYYEVMPLLLGTEKLVGDKAIFGVIGHVTYYYDKLEPATFLEFVSTVPYFHSLLKGRYLQKKTNEEEKQPINISSESGIHIVNATLKEFTKILLTKSPGVLMTKKSESFFGDLVQADQSKLKEFHMEILKHRKLGLASYNDIREFCKMPRAKHFSQFIDNMDVKNIKIISKLYKEPGDVDLYVGIHAETLLPGVFVGPTLYCIMSNQMVHWRRSDRFWYESANAPNAYTTVLLEEVRYMKLARIICNVGDGIRKIQPEALKIIANENQKISCDLLPDMDFMLWKDENCKSQDLETTKDPDLDRDDDDDENEIPMYDPLEEMFIKQGGGGCPLGYS